MAPVLISVPACDSASRLAQAGGLRAACWWGVADVEGSRGFLEDPRIPPFPGAYTVALPLVPSFPSIPAHPLHLHQTQRILRLSYIGRCSHGYVRIRAFNLLLEELPKELEQYMVKMPRAKNQMRGPSSRLKG